VHPAILSNDLCVAALFLEWQVSKKSGKKSGGSKKYEDVYTILLTTPLLDDKTVIKYLWST
jgi:hypothetical protein